MTRSIRDGAPLVEIRCADCGKVLHRLTREDTGRDVVTFRRCLCDVGRTPRALVALAASRTSPEEPLAVGVFAEIPLSRLRPFIARARKTGKTQRVDTRVPNRG